MSTLSSPASARAQAENPFLLQTVPDMDSSEELVDVASLHADARQSLLRGLQRVQRGRAYVSAVIGEAGLGKSHLLWWLRRRSTQASLHVPFGILPDLAQPFRHALRQLLAALCKKLPTPQSELLERPIDVLLWNGLLNQCCDLLDAARLGTYQGPGALLKLVGPLCIEAGQRRGVVEFAKRAQPDWQKVEPGLRAYLLSLPTEMSIDSAARAVLLQFPYAERRGLCTAWLAGEDLSVKDRERIGAKQSINNEPAARYVLCSLTRLIGVGIGQSVTVTYDQVDTIAEQLGTPGLQCISEVIAALQQSGSGTLQVLACRPTTWAQFSEKTSRQGANQLKQVDDTLLLQTPKTDDLKALIQGRLAAGTSGTATSRLPKDALSNWPSAPMTPRAALAYFSDRLQGPDAASPATNKRPADEAPAASPNKRDAKSVPGTSTSRRDAVSNLGLGQEAKSSSKPSTAAPAATAAGAGKAVGRPSNPMGPIRVSPKVQPSAAAKPSPTAGASGDALLSVPPPSGQSPSATWMELADENDPLAQAIAQAKADLKLPEAPKAKASGGPAKSAVPAPAPAPAPAAPSAVSGALSPLPMPSDYHTLEPTRPSAQSPSVTWMALADENDLLSAAIADAQAELGPKAQSAAPLPEPKKPAPKPAAKPAPKPAVAPAPVPTPMTHQKSQDSPTVSWKSMASDDALAPVLAAYQSAQARTEEDRAVPPGVGSAKKTTQAKLPSVQAMTGKGGLSPEAVLQAMGNRNTIEENMLAQELGVNLTQLAPALSQLENRAAVRVMTLPGGKRSVSKV